MTHNRKLFILLCQIHFFITRNMLVILAGSMLLNDKKICFLYRPTAWSVLFHRKICFFYFDSYVFVYHKKICLLFCKNIFFYDNICTCYIIMFLMLSFIIFCSVFSCILKCIWCVGIKKTCK